MERNFEVVSKVGHDLSRYLTRTKAYNELLLNRFEKTLNEEEKSFFDGIKQECDSLTSLPRPAAKGWMGKIPMARVCT